MVLNVFETGVIRKSIQHLNYLGLRAAHRLNLLGLCLNDGTAGETKAKYNVVSQPKAHTCWPHRTAPHPTAPVRHSTRPHIAARDYNSKKQRRWPTNPDVVLASLLRRLRCLVCRHLRFPGLCSQRCVLAVIESEAACSNCCVAGSREVDLP